MLDFPNIMIIGLTGMSGAGKSTVSEVFRTRGFSVINCDAIARNVARRREFLEEVAERFSPDMLRPDGTLDRPKVASLIYNDEVNRGKYQRVIFPYIIYDIIEGIHRAKSSVLLDAPTLFEARLDFICDKIVSVCADDDLCAARIAERDNISPEKARERISAQHDAAFFKKSSDYFIENNGTCEELRHKTEVIIDMIQKTE